jgi:hypothetical protein
MSIMPHLADFFKEYQAYVQRKEWTCTRIRRSAVRVFIYQWREAGTYSTYPCGLFKGSGRESIGLNGSRRVLNNVSSIIRISETQETPDPVRMEKRMRTEKLLSSSMPKMVRER